MQKLAAGINTSSYAQPCVPAVMIAVATIVSGNGITAVYFLQNALKLTHMQGGIGCCQDGRGESKKGKGG